MAVRSGNVHGLVGVLGFVSKREGEAPAEPVWPTKQEAQQEFRPPGNAASPGFGTKPSAWQPM